MATFPIDIPLFPWNTGYITLCVVTLLLVLKIVVVVGLLARTRNAKKVYRNPEDAEKLGGEFTEDDEDVNRISRMHLNDVDSLPVFIVWFFSAYWVYEESGNTGTSYQGFESKAWGLFVLAIIYLFARIAHGVCFYFQLQPWRTLVYVIGDTCIFLAPFTVLGYVHKKDKICGIESSKPWLTALTPLWHCRLQLGFALCLLLHAIRRLVVGASFPVIRSRTKNVPNPEDAKLIRGGAEPQPPGPLDVAVQETHHFTVEHLVIPMMGALACSFPAADMHKPSLGNPRANVAIQGILLILAVMYSVFHMIPKKITQKLSLAVLIVLQVFGLVILCWACDTSLNYKKNKSWEDGALFAFAAVTGCGLILYLKMVIVHWLYTAYTMAKRALPMDDMETSNLSGIGESKHKSAASSKLSNMHSNDVENIPLMVVISFVICMSHKNSATSYACGAFIIIFTLMRVAMSFCHYFALQPFRSIVWGIGALCLIAQTIVLVCTHAPGNRVIKA